MSSKPRPIHTIHRDLRNTPDKAEPSFSYEEESYFLGGNEEDVEDEFHRRLANNNRTRDSFGAGSTGGGGGGGPNITSSGSGAIGNIGLGGGAGSSGIGGVSSAAGGGGGGGGGGSFWRTETPVLQFPSPISAKTHGIGFKGRKTSGGLLGAALQLHSQSSGVGGADDDEPVTPMRIRSDEPSNGRYQRSNSSLSQSSSQGSSSRDRSKKDAARQRAQARRLKLESQRNEVDAGYIETQTDQNGSSDANYLLHRSVPMAPLDNDSTSPRLRAISDSSPLQSSGSNRDVGYDGATVSSDGDSTSDRTPTSSLLSFGKGNTNRASGVLFGKSSSLIFPTGVEPPQKGSSDASASGGGCGAGGNAGDPQSVKKHKVHLLLDQCEAIRFPFKKKLMLNSLNLTVSDIPVKDLFGTSLGNSLHKLSLAGNRLSTLPAKLVTCLPVLKTLDLSQCQLHQLPERWNLGQLKRLNLSHNRLTDFPEEAMLEGLLELQELNLYGNKVSVIVVPQSPKLLAKLETLNLGYNDLSYIPEELDRLKSLRTLKVMNNFLDKVPMRICDMELKTIDVSSNPIIQPPIETCERGICSMKRYYQCLRMEEQSQQKALEALQSRAARQSKKKPSKKTGMRGFAKPKFGLGRKSSDEGRLSDTSSLGTSATTEKSVGDFGSSTKLGTISTSTVASAASSIADKVALAGAARSVSMNLPPLSPTTSTGSSNLAKSSQSLRKSDTVTVASTAGTIASEAKHEAVRRTVSLDSKPFEKALPETEHVKEGVSVDVLAGKDFGSNTSVDMLASEEELPPPEAAIDDITVNDTLKVIFVGMAMAGKTSMIKRLIEGENAVIPKRDERTVGVDIYSWDPKVDKRFEHIDSRIEFQDKQLQGLCGDVNVKFSVWDFAGQHVYHATHELFFSPRALYVLVWDMGATNPATKQRKPDYAESAGGAFSLAYDSDEEESDEDDDFTSEEEARRAERALERDIDDKVQFWVDCIQTSAPGAAILPVASFDDLFSEGGSTEAKRRCNALKQRLLKHEARRIQGIKDRLKEYNDQNRANDEAALRLRNLLCAYQRPKLIFGDTEDDAVVRVSGAKYTGFAQLTERIINIAAGRDKCHSRYPVFHGHVGARIPRMRLQVRDAVRRMRDRFKVVEWGYFISQVMDGQKNPTLITSSSSSIASSVSSTVGGGGGGAFGSGGNNVNDNGTSTTTNNIMVTSTVEDISDALHFLTNIGELSYFGGVLPDKDKMPSSPSTTDGLPPMNGSQASMISNSRQSSVISAITTDDESALSEDEDDDEHAFLSIDNTSITMPTTDDGTMTTLGETLSGGLSQFVFLNPRWLVAAVACILRHDLDREIQETRRSMAASPLTLPKDNFKDGILNCPIITADDACMLWQAKKFTKKAAERAQEYSNNMALRPFEFLQLLLVRFGVFVPIDLGIEKAFLGGVDFTRRLSNEGSVSKPEEITIGGPPSASPLQATFFFLPSLLGPGEPAEAWTYKSTDSWKATLCHSVLFPDGVPPGLMERITAKVLSHIYAIQNDKMTPSSLTGMDGKPVILEGGKLSVKEVLCWRTAFLVKLGMQVVSPNCETRESIVEVFCALVDKDSHLCVGSDYMPVGSRRLVTSGKGQEGDGGRKIWKGGYLLVVKAVQRVMDEYGGLEFEKQGFCPECLAKKAVSEAGSWDFAVVRAAAKNGEGTIHCQHGHRVDTRLVAGPVESLQTKKVEQQRNVLVSESDQVVPINDLLRGVVCVGLWDGKTRKVVRVGSGFIADKKRGLIVTASHTLMNIWGDKSTPFGENYYGLRQGKVVIGIIPRKKGEENGTEAVFRYFAKIVTKDPSIDQGVCHLDACVLRITTRMENDVGGSGDGCGDQIERLLLNNPNAMKQEKLQQLKITDRCELDEQVRIVGYNQGGEGLMGPGVNLNRFVDFARGYVCKKFGGGESVEVDAQRHRFKPREEIVIICPTIGGHSGGPCVNQQGEVIGILSRADPAESQRCYLVPTQEWKSLLREAKHTL